jgi:hypothetical protein
MKKIAICCAALAAVMLWGSGCYSVKPLERPEQESLSGEGSVVFARAKQYTLWFGSHSPREYFEVVYEQFSRNDAGFAVVEVGIRYRGGVSWTDWYKSIPQTVTLGARCNFYSTAAAQAEGPIVYSTNCERIVLQRGNTYAYKAVCPVRSVEGYQLVLGE